MQSSSVLVLIFILGIRAEESGEKCHKANFLPDLPLSEAEKHCDFSHHCSKVTCVVKANNHKLTVGVEIKKCDDETYTATVSLKSPSSDVDWSHTLKDGEKAKMKLTPSMFSGGLSVSDASLFIKVGIKKINESNLNFTVWMVGEVTVFGQVSPFKVLLLQGMSPSAVPTGNCSRSWLLIVLIVVPVIVSVFVALGIAMYCYRRRRLGLHSGRVPMERLTNEV